MPEIPSTKINEISINNSSSQTETRREEIVDFIQRYLGTPYLYGSTHPEVDFDCSGFINYVYQHFGYEVPRSSTKFFNFGKELPTENVQ